jgi:hypothetical protein
VHFPSFPVLLQPGFKFLNHGERLKSILQLNSPMTAGEERNERKLYCSRNKLLLHLTATASAEIK